jgi:hypothetical protein
MPDDPMPAPLRDALAALEAQDLPEPLRAAVLEALAWAERLDAVAPGPAGPGGDAQASS